MARGGISRQWGAHTLLPFHRAVQRLAMTVGLSVAVGLMPGPAGASITAATHFSRVVTLAPHITEMVFAAGAGKRIVGTVSSSDYPPQARNIPRVGNGIQINIEQVVGLRPDLIIAWRESGAARVLAPIAARLHIPIVYIAPQTLRDIPKDIIDLGRQLGSATQATQTAQRLSQRISTLSARYAGRKPVSTFIEVGATPLYTLGGDPLINDALRLCAGVNVFAQAPLPAPQINAESVLAARPDTVIIPTTNARRLAARTSYWAKLHLTAALTKQVYGIAPGKLFRPGPRLIDATATLCQDLDHAR